jgi:hypothetical protein
MSNDANNTVYLADIADVRPGYPFRGAIKDAPDGEAAVVQIKNVDAERGIDWSGLAKARLEGKRRPDWLKPGDILFTARGNRNAAAAVGEVPFKAVSAPHLFLVRIGQEEKAIPEFVAWLMNQPEAQHYFSRSATGSYITSIRKPVLQKLRLQLPSLEKQRLVVQLLDAARKEQVLLEELIENRKLQLNLVARNLMG